MKRTVRPRAKRDNNFVEIRIACGACGSQSETETQDGFICICFSYFFISGHSFIFSFVSTSLTYITIPRNKGKLKITCDKKLTTTYFSFKTSRRFWLAKSTPAWSYENRVSKHLVIFLNFPCLIACLLCCLLMSFFFACFVVRDLCRSGCRQNYYLTPIDLLHFWRHRFIKRKNLPNLVISSWLRRIVRVYLDFWKPG